MSRGQKWKDHVGRQNCMQSRQDYIIVVKEKRRATSHEEDSPGDAGTCGVCRVCGEAV